VKTDCNQNPAANLKPANLPVKRKRQASAAFLGVMTISPQVVEGCCIRTTFFSASCIALANWSPGETPFRNTGPNRSEPRIRRYRESATHWPQQKGRNEKGRSVSAAAFRKLTLSP
jgi:hypothetical protein